MAGKSLKPYDLYDEAVKKIFGSECYGGKSCGPTKVVYRHAHRHSFGMCHPHADTLGRDDSTDYPSTAHTTCP